MTDVQITTRTRTIHWEDPLPAARTGREMSGIDYLRAIASGTLPPAPFALLMGIRPAEIEEGRVVFVVEPAEYHYNPIGVVHGGLAATLLDSAMACAVHSLLPAGAGYTTLEFKVNLVRALTIETGEVRAEGTVIHMGGRIATAEGKLVDRSGKLYAHATTTCIILRP